jgi:hypothetical protein
MQPLILVLTTLFSHILSDRVLVPLLTHGVDEVSACPKRSTPKKFLHLWNSLKNFARRDTLDNLCYLPWANRRY